MGNGMRGELVQGCDVQQSRGTESEFGTDTFNRMKSGLNHARVG